MVLLSVNEIQNKISGWNFVIWCWLGLVFNDFMYRTFTMALRDGNESNMARFLGN